MTTEHVDSKMIWGDCSPTKFRSKSAAQKVADYGFRNSDQPYRIYQRGTRFVIQAGKVRT